MPSSLEDNLLWAEIISKQQAGQYSTVQYSTVQCCTMTIYSRCPAHLAAGHHAAVLRRHVDVVLGGEAAQSRAEADIIDNLWMIDIKDFLDTV